MTFLWILAAMLLVYLAYCYWDAFFLMHVATTVLGRATGKVGQAHNEQRP